TVLVVGSPNSSNSNRLVEVVRRAGTPAYLIDDEMDIELSWLDGAHTVGLAAGASAPERLGRRVLSSLGGPGAVSGGARTRGQEAVRFGRPRELGVTRGD